MVRKKKFILVLVLAFFMFLGNVRAEEDKVCKPSELSELRTMAANVKITYIPVSVREEYDEPDPETGATAGQTHYLDIKIYNMNSKLFINVDKGREDFVVDSNNVGPDGSITLRQIPMSESVTYEFEIMSDEYGCYKEKLRTIKLTLPKFNFYSQLAACQDIPDYYLCQEYTTFEVDGATFYNKFDEYKAKLLTLEEAGDMELDNNGIVSTAISIVSRHKYAIVGVVVAIGVALTIIIVKRKKSVL